MHATWQFKTFIQCAMDNSEYYEPFLNMLLGESDAGPDETGSPEGEAKEGKSTG